MSVFYICIPYENDNLKISGYAEDTPNLGIFTYRLKGFDQQPTDHYLRTHYIDATPMYQYQKPFCYGSMPRHKVLHININNIK